MRNMASISLLTGFTEQFSSQHHPTRQDSAGSNLLRILIGFNIMLQNILCEILHVPPNYPQESSSIGLDVTVVGYFEKY
jgi:hypothetical protein